MAKTTEEIVEEHIHRLWNSSSCPVRDMVDETLEWAAQQAEAHQCSTWCNLCDTEASNCGCDPPALYCLLVAYCLIWVPWCIEHRYGRLTPITERIGYGWLWAGPRVIDPAATYGSFARPDFALIAMRLTVVTVICIAVSLLVGMNRAVSKMRT